MKPFTKLFPFLVLALGLLYLAPRFFNSYNSGKDGFDFDAYAALPVQDGGRFKPMDTVARMTLMLVSGKQTFLDENNQSQPAIKWLLYVMRLDHRDSASRNRIFNRKVFRIENDQVLSLLGLEPRSATHFRYAISEFETKIVYVVRQAQRVREKDSKDRELYDTKIAELECHLALFMALTKNETPRVVIPPVGDKDAWDPLADYAFANGDWKKLQESPTAAAHYFLLKTYGDNTP